MTEREAADARQAAAPTIGFDAFWDGRRFQGHTVFAVENGMLHPTGDQRADHEAGGTLIPRLTDHHVHLGLTDPADLFANGITDVVDLGWIPEVASRWLDAHPGHPAVQIAGALITAPGGYPKNAGWGPPGSTAEVADAAEAAEAAQKQLVVGASRIKVTLNTDAGPTVDDSTLAAIVEEAHAAGVPVTVHAQGAGQVARALEAGADQLAHAPFSERVDDDTLQRAVDAGMSWVSTLDIHGWGRPTPALAIAIDNVRRFAAAGGRILYGTDLGNGPLPVGVNERELGRLVAAGLDGAQLLQSIAGNARTPGPRFAWLPTPPPASWHLDDLSALPAWLATARGHTTTTILGASA
ncbi:amidohydrolase family protein [Leifsonia sp. NPDC058230]|uniref:amidohydrolase family protein n=1 Tax=Leifsonia sp. NPDC058230 TaxID=3346391 RepID=UPI0036DA9DA0